MANIFVEGDTATTLSATLKDQDGSAIDVSSSTVRIFWQVNGGNVHSDVMTQDDGANGVVSYQFNNLDLPLEAGTMKVEIEIAESDDEILTSREALEYGVRPRIKTNVLG